MLAPILEVNDLSITFSKPHDFAKIIDDISFTIPRGQTLALVGGSGSGKSVTAYAILDLLESPGRVTNGSIVLNSVKYGKVIVTDKYRNADVIFKVRGSICSLISQEPLSALSPVHTIGNQMLETILCQKNLKIAEAREVALNMLATVNIDHPVKRFMQYPHELSGGIRQRIVIAMALVGNPELVIADEPTTALDVINQAHIINLLRTLQKSLGFSILLVSHDIRLIAQMSDVVSVLYKGKIVESGPVRRVLANPEHSYTKQLVRSFL